MAQEQLHGVYDMLADAQQPYEQIDLETAQDLMLLIDTASDSISKALGYIATAIERMDNLEANLNLAQLNTESACTCAMDADTAHEQMEAAKSAILQETPAAMKAQANLGSQTIEELFR